MKISEQVKIIKDINVNGVICSIYGVNVHDNEDTTKVFPFESDITLNLNFHDRFRRAITELESDIKEGMTIKDAYDYYKENTDNDNANYYGDMVFVYTKEYDPERLLYGIRMD